MTAFCLTTLYRFAAACVGRRLALLPVLGLLVAIAVPAKAADPVKGTVSVFTDGGYTRLLFRFDEDVGGRVTVAGAIMVINFKKPVQISVERLNLSAPDYISAARRDPDGTAVRLALARKVKVNTIPAGERFYVDLLPENWTGVLPGLPQEVVDDLTRRTREAEKLLYQHRIIAKQKEPPLIRVRVAKQPTFMRYVFSMPETADVVPEQSEGKLKLSFDQAIKWDLADAKATMPSTLESINAESEFDSVAVTFTLNGAPEVRTFREDRSIVVDIGSASGSMKPAAPTAAAKPAGSAPLAIDAPETIPSRKEVATEPKAAAPSAPKGEPLRADVPSQPPKADAPPAPKAETPKLAPRTDVQNADGHREGAKAEATKPEAEALKPEATKVEAAKLEVAKPDPVKPDAVRPQAIKPEAPVAHALSAALAEAVKEPPPAAAAPAQPKAVARDAAPVRASPGHGVVATTQQSGSTLRIDFPFATATPAAVFRRADLVWLVFDTASNIDIAALNATRDAGIRSATLERGADGEAVVRVKLTRPRLVSVATDGPGWTVTVADAVTAPAQPLSFTRSILGQSQANVAVNFDQPSKVHVLRDSEVGDKLLVITGLGPARGFLKRQDFVELSALTSAHGVVVQPVADDVVAQLESDRIVFSRPGGLSLSPTTQAEEQIASTFHALTFDPQTWGFDRQAPFAERQSELMRLAAGAPEAKRKQARLNLARFYLARDLAAEAKGVLDVALAEQRDTFDVTGTILRAAAEVMMDRPEDALKELAAPNIGGQQDAPLWRAIAYARQGKWPEAREIFKTSDGAIASLPIELQRMARLESLRATIEVRDYAAASRLLNDFEASGVPADLEPTVKVLAGRLAEGLGRVDDALANYRAAAAGEDRPAAAQGRLRELALMLEKGQMEHKDVISALETLTTVWRGDETETEGLKLLAHLYTQDNRFRDAFHVMRTALKAHPNSDMTRKIQDEAAATFDSLFLEGKGDLLPPVEALGLFYDYRELTPIGRRGDEMIRRLADRLVSVDLLDQAAELLQHQVDHRLQGAARAQVATRLAVIYLMNRKPDRALATLQSTRSGEFSNELRDQRLLLEARSLSDLGRHQLALELIANIKGPEVTRLRADILWAARNWRLAAEQIELLHGERWREFPPLNDSERSDIMRAAIGYSLADESIGLARMREKYLAKMSEGPDARTFEAVTNPQNAGGPDFIAAASKFGGVDTLHTFLRDIRKRYPDAAPPVSAPKAATPAKPAPQAAAQPVVPARSAMQEAPKTDPGASPLPPKAPQGVPLRPDMTPTGSITSTPRAVAR